MASSCTYPQKDISGRTIPGYRMPTREKTLAILLILSLIMNILLLAVALVPGGEPARVLSYPPEDDMCPILVPTEREVGDGGTASMHVPVILQKIEVNRGGPFAPGRVTEEGAMVEVSVEVAPGRGRVLIQTTPLMGVIFQDAANHAVAVAENRSHMNLSTSDVIFSIQGPEEVSEVDGPSAGALMAALLLSVLEEFSLNESVTVTGTIDESGEIGPVGGILMKAEAAAASGKTLLLLPGKNNQVFEYREEIWTLGGLGIMRRRPAAVDTKEYIEENYGIGVEYVDSIDRLLTDLRMPAEASVTPVT